MLHFNHHLTVWRAIHRVFIQTEEMERPHGNRQVDFAAAVASGYMCRATCDEDRPHIVPGRICLCFHDKDEYGGEVVDVYSQFRDHIIGILPYDGMVAHT